MPWQLQPSSRLLMGIVGCQQGLPSGTGTWAASAGAGKSHHHFSPRKPRVFTWGAEDGQSAPATPQAHPHFPAPWCCRVSLQISLFPWQGQTKPVFSSFPTSKIQLRQHLPRCSTAICWPEAVLKQQLNLLGSHLKAAKTLQFATA